MKGTERTFPIQRQPVLERATGAGVSFKFGRIFTATTIFLTPTLIAHFGGGHAQSARRRRSDRGGESVPRLSVALLPSVVRTIRSSLDAGQLGKPGLLRMHVWSPASRPPGDDTKLTAVDLAL